MLPSCDRFNCLGSQQLVQVLTTTLHQPVGQLSQSLDGAVSCKDLGIVKLCTSIMALRPAIWDGDKDGMVPLPPGMPHAPRLTHPDCLCDHTAILKTVQFLVKANNQVTYTAQQRLCICCQGAHSRGMGRQGHPQGPELCPDCHFCRVSLLD